MWVRILVGGVGWQRAWLNVGVGMCVVSEHVRIFRNGEECSGRFRYDLSPLHGEKRRARIGTREERNSAGVRLRVGNDAQGGEAAPSARTCGAYSRPGSVCTTSMSAQSL
eukprot:3505249-Pleurochrysis_carterae.AAC.1